MVWIPFSVNCPNSYTWTLVTAPAAGNVTIYDQSTYSYIPWTPGLTINYKQTAVMNG